MGAASQSCHFVFLTFGPTSLLTSRRQEFATNQLASPSSVFFFLLAKQAKNLQYFLVVTRSLEVEITELDHYQEKHLSSISPFVTRVPQAKSYAAPQNPGEPKCDDAANRK